MTSRSGVVAWRDEHVVDGLELCGIEVLFVLLPVVVVGASELAEAFLDRSLFEVREYKLKGLSLVQRKEKRLTWIGTGSVMNSQR